MLEYSEDILKKIFPKGTIVENNGYKEGLFKELEKIYIMENLTGTQLYKIVAEKGNNENINRKRGKTMITIGDFKSHDKVIFQGETYEILGIGNRSFNNVQCQNIATKKRKWLDIDTEVLPYYENLCDTNPFDNNKFGG